MHKMSWPFREPNKNEDLTIIKEPMGKSNGSGRGRERLLLENGWEKSLYENGWERSLLLKNGRVKSLLENGRDMSGKWDGEVALENGRQKSPLENGMEKSLSKMGGKSHYSKIRKCNINKIFFSVDSVNIMPHELFFYLFCEVSERCN